MRRPRDQHERCVGHCAKDAGELIRGADRSLELAERPEHRVPPGCGGHPTGQLGDWTLLEYARGIPVRLAAHLDLDRCFRLRGTP